MPACPIKVNRTGARRFASRPGLTVLLLAAVSGGLWLAPLLGLAQAVPATLPDLRLASGGSVTALAVQNDGKIIIAGSFQSVNDVPRAGLARLHPDGLLDLTWNPSVTTSPNQPLNTIIEAGTNIYIGGSFNVNNNQTDQRAIARLSVLDGSTDQAWNPGVTGGVVFAIAVSGSNIYIGGTFTNVGGQSRSGLARHDLDGALDSSWNPAPDGIVRQLIVTGANVFVAGGFTNIGGQTRSGLAKLSAATGQTDAMWNPNPQGGLLSRWSLALVGTNLFVGGDFLVIGNTNRSGLAKLTTEGAGDVDQNWYAFNNNGGVSPFTVLALAVLNDALFIGGYHGQMPFLAKASAAGGGSVDSAWGTSANVSDAANQNGRIKTLGVTPGGLLVGGSFVHLGVIGSGGTPALGIGKLDALTGRRDETFRGQAQVPGTTLAIARQADGRIIIGGEFQSAGGLARANLVRISNSGEVDPTWSPNTDGPVFALALDGSDLFVGGFFTKAGGLARTNLAKIATRGIDSAVTNWDARIETSYAPVWALVADGTNLFVGGGYFYGWGTIAGQSRNSLAKLSTSNPCLADNNWVVDAGPGGVNALALEGTNLFVGGGFLDIGGQNRIGLAKVSTRGAGLVDANWSPAISNFTASVYALALSETNLFVGGNFKPASGQGRNKLAKLSTAGTGQLDPLWLPEVTAFDGNGVRALALSGKTNLYAAGNFSALNGQVANVARISTLETGAVDLVFAPNPSGPCYALFVSGNDVYVGGSFGSFAGVQKGGFAFQPVADAPVLIQDSPTNLFIFRNPLDGPEVTHFRILSKGNEPLFHINGGTQVHDGDFITVAQGSAGLIFVPNGVITVASAINNSANGTGSASSTLVMAATAPPVFTFTSQNYSVREGQGNIVVTVRKYGSGAATVNYATSDQTATGGLDYQIKNGTLNFSAADKFKNIIITIADDLQNEGDEQFGVTLSLPQNPNGAIAAPATANVIVVDNDIVGLSDSFMTQAPPAAPPLSNGVLIVALQPTNGQWRLEGERNWHNSSNAVAGLVTGNYKIEFRPVTNYREPNSESRAISAGTTNFFSFSYDGSGASGHGRLSVSIEPPDVASNPDLELRGQWRRPGEAWHDSDDVITNLATGNYAVEFKSVTSRLTPLPRIVRVVDDGFTHSVSAIYLFSPASATTAPGVVPFEKATTNEPHCYNGQIQTRVGFGSGFVVKPRVVLTAGHVLFDDVTLSYVKEVRWFFQRYRDKLEPVPQVPRGWYVFDGYAAQREVDSIPGISTPESQQLDAAAMYFPEDAGRGGFGGYVSTDAEANEYLLSANDKFLAGYPLDGVTETNQGKLHASSPTNLTFVHLYGGVFATTNLQSFPGSSGGPLYVQTSADTFYPAAIYLGGSGQTLVRAINSEVVDLINRADRAANGGGNSTGGGVTILSIGATTDPVGLSQVTVRLTPTNATVNRPGWRIRTDADYFTAPSHTVTVITYAPLMFKPVPGFIAPSDTNLTVAAGQEVTLLAEYIPIPPVVGFSYSNGLSLTGFSNATYRVEFATNLTPPATWTLLTNATLTGSSTNLANAQPVSAGNRFYRAALVP